MLMPWLEQRSQTVHKSDDVTIEALQSALTYLYHIDSSYLPSLIAHTVKHGDDSLLVRKCDIESPQMRIAPDYLGKQMGRRNLKVDILGIYMLLLKLFCKEGSTETVSQGETYYTVSIHSILFSLFIRLHLVARNMVLIPPQKRSQRTSENPFLRSICSISSACGKASMLEGR